VTPTCLIVTTGVFLCSVIKETQIGLCLMMTIVMWVVLFVMTKDTTTDDEAVTRFRPYRRTTNPPSVYLHFTCSIASAMGLQL